MLFKIAGLEYRIDKSGFNKAPKSKQPYIDDEGEIIADSTFIRFHIEKKYGFDFDAGLDAQAKGVAWAVEKMFEDHLYWMIVRERWCNDANFDRGPRMFFDDAPALIRPLIIFMVRKKVAKSLQAQGLGRHSDAEFYLLAQKTIDAVANIIGDNKYLAGDKICGADATTFAFIDGLACPHFDSPVIGMIEKHQNLMEYLKRMREEWYGDL